MRKKLIKSISTVVIAVLAIWVWSRWDTWFHNPEELSWIPPQSPTHILLTFGDSTENSRNISWQCDTFVQSAHVELIKFNTNEEGREDSSIIKVNAKGETFSSRKGIAAYYAARLRKLNYDTHYKYRVVTGNKSSDWYFFYIPAKKDKVTFLYVGDVQDTIQGKADIYLHEALQQHKNCEFLVCGGDLTEHPANQYWNETFRDIDSIAQQIPLLNVTGNHDYLKGLPMKLERRFSLVFSYFLDSQIDENQVYTLHNGPVQFFLLDSNREFPGLYTQRKWLEQQLQESKAKWKILVLHHPLYSIKGNNNLIQRWMFNDLVKKYHVDLVLQGHEHAYARMTKHLDDDHSTPTTPVYTVSHCSPKNYRIQFDERFDKFGISSRYYQVIEVRQDTLVMAAYEVYHHTLYDSLRIVKQPNNKSPKIEDYGRNIPEYMEYTPEPGNKKDGEYAKRIADYKNRHPERIGK